jgi:Protein of unknown function (DUF3631)
VTITPILNAVPNDPILSNILDDIENYMKEHYKFKTEYDVMIASSYVVMTYIYPLFRAIPYLGVDSKYNGHGKSTFGMLMYDLCNKPLLGSSFTNTAVETYKDLSNDYHTLIHDEIDLSLNSTSRDTYQLLAIFNGGYKQNVGTSAKGQPDGSLRLVDFFGPKILIGMYSEKLQGNTALLQRIIRIEAEKVEVGRISRAIETAQITRFYSKGEQAKNIVKRLQEWADNEELDYTIERYIRQSAREGLFVTPEIEIGNREKEIWQPLVVINDMTGTERAESIRNAIVPRLNDDNESLSPDQELDMYLRASMTSGINRVGCYLQRNIDGAMPQDLSLGYTNNDFGWGGTQLQLVTNDRGSWRGMTLRVDVKQSKAALHFNDIHEFARILSTVSRRTLTSAYVGEVYDNADRFAKNDAQRARKASMYRGEKRERVYVLDISHWSGWNWTKENDTTDLENPWE